MGWGNYLKETTFHPLAAAYLQILVPRKPFPPATTIFLAAPEAALAGEAMMVSWSLSP